MNTVNMQTTVCLVMYKRTEKHLQTWRPSHTSSGRPKTSVLSTGRWCRCDMIR